MKMSKKAICFLWSIVCTTVPLLAQQSVNTSGGEITNNAGYVSYSVGQTAYIHIEGETGSLLQGVQQPYHFTIVGLEEAGDDMGISLFPNPADQFVNLQVNPSARIDASRDGMVGIYDMNGKLVRMQPITAPITIISLSNLTESMYLLTVWQGKIPLTSFKLFKSN
jgi:hypothetical protein